MGDHSRKHILTALAWPYANGPRHIGHVSGFGLPSDMFSRYQRMAGNRVLMVSGTDEHGTPIQVQADAEGVSVREIVDRYNGVIGRDLANLGMTYDLFTRTTTRNHYAVTQEIFLTLLKNGYIFPKVTLGAISPSTGRTLPDRYIEGTCPICSYPHARGDQCDNCGNQLDPTDLINPVSKINGETPLFVEQEHYFLDLPAFTDVLGEWMKSKEGQWRPNVLKFSLNLLDDLQPRAITRDLDWGVPVPLDGWRDRNDKRIYVWFDAVIGYLSASIEWARRSGDPDAWRAWWNDPSAESYYFMGKDNITFHSEIWPAMLLGYNGQGAKGGAPGPLGRLDLPSEVVSSEFLTMEGRKFSSSRQVVIYVKDFLARYDVDALRYYVAVAGPETHGGGHRLHLEREFVRPQQRRTGRHLGQPGQPRGVTLRRGRTSSSISPPWPRADLRRGPCTARHHLGAPFAAVGEHLSATPGSSSRPTRPCARLARRTSTSPSRHRGSCGPEDPERMATVLHTTLQAIRRRREDAAHAVPAALVAGGARDARRRGRLVGHAADRDRGRRGRPVVPGDHWRGRLRLDVPALGVQAGDPRHRRLTSPGTARSPSWTSPWSTRRSPGSAEANPFLPDDQV